MSAPFSIIGGSAGTSNTQGEGLTRYWPFYGNTRTQTTEANAELPIRQDGTWKNLCVNVAVNGNGANPSATFTTRKNQADTSQSVSYTASQTGLKYDTTNNVTVADGDEIALKCVTGDPAGSGKLVTVTYCGGEFFPSDTTIVSSWISSGSSGVAFSTDSATRYLLPIGTISHQSTEARGQTKLNNACTLRDFHVYITANARTSTTTYTVRKNGADTTCTVSVTSTTTGRFEDATHTASIAATDLVGISEVTGSGSGQSITPGGVGFWTDSAIGIAEMHGGTASGYGQASNLTRYGQVMGDVASVQSTEANAQMTANTAFTATNLQTNVYANSMSSDSTFTLRQNGSDTALSITYTSGQTGWKIDTDTVSISAGDELDYKLLTGATGTSIGINVLSFEGIVPYLRVISTDVATETDSEQSITMKKLVSTGYGAETDSAQAPSVGIVSGAHYVTMGLSTETDSAQSLSKVKVVSHSYSSETDSAQSLSKVKVVSHSYPSEADSAQSLSKVKVVSHSYSSETDSSQRLNYFRACYTGRADETDLGLACSWIKIVDYAPSKAVSPETDLAFSLSGAKVLEMGGAGGSKPSAANSALAPLVGSVADSGLEITTEVAIEIDVAQVPHLALIRQIGIATETDSVPTVIKARRRIYTGHVPSSETELAYSGIRIDKIVDYSPSVEIDVDPRVDPLVHRISMGVATEIDTVKISAWFSMAVASEAALGLDMIKMVDPGMSEESDISIDLPPILGTIDWPPYIVVRMWKRVA